MKILHNYVNGEFDNDGMTLDKLYKKPGGMLSKRDPSTGDWICTFPQTTEKDVHSAYKIARGAFRGWKGRSRIYRAEFFYKIAQIIERRRDEIARVISFETGKNYNESIAEVNEALHMAQYAFGSGRTSVGEAVASELAEKDAYMIRKPKGVIAIISPFNFPLAIGSFWCAAPALVEGNTVIIKPSEDAPWTTHLAAEIYHEAGVPPGVFNVIHGDGKVGSLLSLVDVDHICFTGSAEVGQIIRKVAAESWNKTTSCELGSKSAVIVFDDANFELAVSAAVASAFKLSGQRCVSSGRIIVQRSIFDKFAKRFVEVAQYCKPGPPFVTKYHTTGGTPDCVTWETQEPNPDAYYGPIVTKAGLDKVIFYNNLVFSNPSATVLMRGELLPIAGNFIPPTVYTTEWNDEPYLKNEVFGPHVAIIPFDDIHDAVRIYNDTDYGLALGVCTEDFKKARYCRDNCDFGMCYWNGGSIAAESHLAFGGVKKSGNGFPSAARTFRAVTHEVSWTVNHGESISFPQGMK